MTWLLSFLPSSGVTVHMFRHIHAQYCPVRWLETKSPSLMSYKMPKVQKQLPIIMVLLAYVVYCKISTSFVSAISEYFRFWLGVTVFILRHLHAQYCPGQNHSHHYTNIPPVLYSRFQQVCCRVCMASRHARQASAGLALAPANGCVALTPFQPLYICVYPCVLIQLFCRHCGSVITPIAARSLPCIHHVPVYMLIIKVVIYTQWLTVFTLSLLHGKFTVPRCNSNGL